VVITWNEGAAAVDDFKLIDIDGTDQIEIIDNAIVATSFPAATVYVDGQKGTTVDGQWHHVVIVDTTGVNASAMDIGRVSSSYLKGSIDDVRIYNRELSRDEINRLYKIGATFKVNATQTTDSLKNGLVGHWTFDGKDMAGNYAFDKSGNGNRGTLTGSNGVPIRAAGKIGQGLQFDGVDDYVRAPTIAPAQVTVSAWINPNSITDRDAREIVSNTSDSVVLRIDNDDVTSKRVVFWIQRSDSTYFAAYSTVPLSPRTWTHLVGTFDGTNARLYINGVEANNSPVAVNGSILAQGNFLIGVHQDLTRDFFRGIIDDVRIYNRSLSNDEIKRLYNMGR
jgi:hypothetical protein